MMRKLDKDTQKIFKVLAIKKAANQAKYAKTRDIHNRILAKMDEVNENIQRAKVDEQVAQRKFFEREQNQTASDLEMRQYIEETKKAIYNLRLQEKNKLLLQGKKMELEELLRVYQIEMLKLDKKAEYLLS